MTIDTFVEVNPQRIKRVEDARNILQRIHAYEALYRCNAGIIFIQRNHASPLYEIVSQEEGNRWLTMPVTSTTPEFGLKYYSRAYFEALSKRLQGYDVPLPEPLSWEHYRR